MAPFAQLHLHQSPSFFPNFGGGMIQGYSFRVREIGCGNWVSLDPIIPEMLTGLDMFLEQVKQQA